MRASLAQHRERRRQIACRIGAPLRRLRTRTSSHASRIVVDLLPGQPKRLGRAWRPQVCSTSEMSGGAHFSAWRRCIWCCRHVSSCAYAPSSYDGGDRLAASTRSTGISHNMFGQRGGVADESLMSYVGARENALRCLGPWAQTQICSLPVFVSFSFERCRTKLRMSAGRSRPSWASVCRIPPDVVSPNALHLCLAGPQTIQHRTNVAELGRRCAEIGPKSLWGESASANFGATSRSACSIGHPRPWLSQSAGERSALRHAGASTCLAKVLERAPPPIGQGCCGCRRGWERFEVAWERDDWRWPALADQVGAPRVRVLGRLFGHEQRRLFKRC